MGEPDRSAGGASQRVNAGARKAPAGSLSEAGAELSDGDDPCSNARLAPAIRGGTVPLLTCPGPDIHVRAFASLRMPTGHSVGLTLARRPVSQPHCARHPARPPGGSERLLRVSSLWFLSLDKQRKEPAPVEGQQPAASWSQSAEPASRNGSTRGSTPPGFRGAEPESRTGPTKGSTAPKPKARNPRAEREQHPSKRQRSRPRTERSATAAEHSAPAQPFRSNTPAGNA